jgi:hypothetical protein
MVGYFCIFQKNLTINNNRPLGDFAQSGHPGQEAPLSLVA